MQFRFLLVVIFLYDTLYSEITAMCETKKLIDLVRNVPALYDMKSKDYKDINKKSAMWKNIAMKLNLESGTIAKNKWRHLRDCYAKHLRSQLYVGDQCSRKYKRWTWANQMDFLKPHVTTRQVDSLQLGNHSDSDTETKVKSEPTHEVLHYLGDSINDETLVSENCSLRHNLNFNIAEETFEYLQTRKVRRNMDGVDLLFLSYAQTLKTFSPQKQAAVKLQIAQIINAAEVAQLEEHNPLQSSISPPSSS